MLVPPILKPLFFNMLCISNISLSSRARRIALFRHMGYTQDVVGLSETQQGVGKIKRFARDSLILLCIASGAWATQVLPGAPIIEESHYAVPCIVRDAGNTVAALDFHLMYDPALFQPVSVEPGPAALQAGKMVTANMAEPGRYIVVMMGLNQTTILDGVVAVVTLHRIGETPDGVSTLALAQPTFSTWEGKELPAQGGMVRVPVKRPDQATEGEGDGGVKPPDGGVPGGDTVPETETPPVTGAATDGINGVFARASSPKGDGEAADQADGAGISGIAGEIAALRSDADALLIEGASASQTFEPDPTKGGSGAPKTGGDDSPVGPASSLTIEQDTLGEVEKTFVISATSESPAVPETKEITPSFFTRTRWWPVLLFGVFCVGAFWVLRFRLFR